MRVDPLCAQERIPRPMVLMFSSDPHPLNRWASLLTPVATVATTSQWEEFKEIESPRSCSIVAIDRLRFDTAFPELVSFKTRNPLHPVILITRFDPENARSLKDIVVEDVVWWHEIERELPVSLRGFCARDYLRDLAARFRSAEGLSPSLRQAFTLVCASERPILSVKQLAGRIGCSRATLARTWRAAGMQDTLRLQDVLHWVLLLRALTRRRANRSWAVVAAQMGVHPHTLGRLATQLTGQSLRHLNGERLPEVVEAFERAVSQQLLQGAAEPYRYI